MSRTPCSLVILSLLVACGGGPAESDAGDSGADVDDSGLLVAPSDIPCPMGNSLEGLPTDVEVLYVLSSAPAGGDGTEASPLVTITDAMNIASPRLTALLD